MNATQIQKLMETFEGILQYADPQEGIQVEFWLARDLQQLFEYAEWRNFETVIKKAAEACQNAGGTIDDHFLIVEKEVQTGHPKRRAK
jgi:DNA-damage-inducible protein D